VKRSGCLALGPDILPAHTTYFTDLGGLPLPLSLTTLLHRSTASELGVSTFPLILIPLFLCGGGLLLLRLSLSLWLLLLAISAQLIDAGDTVPTLPVPRVMLVAVPHVALLQAGGLENTILADRAVVGVGHCFFLGLLLRKFALQVCFAILDLPCDDG
jgi:hypothetical protein